MSAACKHPRVVPTGLELKINSDPASLRQVRRQIEDFAHAIGLPALACDAVGLAVNEALANVMRHGYGGAPDKPIVIALEHDAEELRVKIRDWSQPFNPADLPRVDVRAKHAAGDIHPGGLGLHCMRVLMDRVEHVPLSDGMLLVMAKRKSPSVC